VKIQSIKTHLLKADVSGEGFYSSQAWFAERKSLIVEITTDTGIIGWGEGGQYGPASPVLAAVNDILTPALIGQDCTNIQVLWDKLYNANRDFGRKGFFIEALSAIDIALWDILGKHLGVPVYTLLGGKYRDKVLTYATGLYYRNKNINDLDLIFQQTEDEAKGYVREGYKAIKMKVGLLGIEDDAKRVKIVRDVIGANRFLMADANHAYSVPQAVSMGRVLEKHNVFWFEEPVIA
jgi:D-galactarolactone cycloisomerase